MGYISFFSFFFNIFPCGYAGLFAWLTKQLLEEGESCCYVTLCCLISLFSMCTSRCHNSCREVEHCGVPLYTAGRLEFDASPFIIFSPILRSEQVSWGQGAGGNKNRGGRCWIPTLISSLCSVLTPLWGKTNKSLIFRYRGRQLEAHVFASLCHWPA